MSLVTDLVDVIFEIGVLLVHISLFICIVCIPVYKVSRLMLTRLSFVWFPPRTQLLRSFIDWRWWILRVLPFVWCVSGAFYFFYGTMTACSIVENLFHGCENRSLCGKLDTSALPPNLPPNWDGSFSSFPDIPNKRRWYLAALQTGSTLHDKQVLYPLPLHHSPPCVLDHIGPICYEYNRTTIDILEGVVSDFYIVGLFLLVWLPTIGFVWWLTDRFFEAYRDQEANSS